MSTASRSVLKLAYVNPAAGRATRPSKVRARAQDLAARLEELARIRPLMFDAMSSTIDYFLDKAREKRAKRRRPGP